MYTTYSGEKVRNQEVTRGLLEHDAGCYGAIALRYLGETVQLPSERERFADIAGDWAMRAAHCARMIQAMGTQRNERNRQRRERDQVYRDCGLRRVRGALGGVYWE